MAHRVLEIPGGGTSFDGGPAVRVLGARDQPVKLIVTYAAAPPSGDGPTQLSGEISFLSVLEYRWVRDWMSYEDHPEHEHDTNPGLIEVMDSAYIEAMASKGTSRNYPGKRFGPFIHEEDVKHYRLVFDDYGRFDVIALGVSIRTVASREPDKTP